MKYLDSNSLSKVFGGEQKEYNFSYNLGRADRNGAIDLYNSAKNGITSGFHYIKKLF